MTRRVAIVGIDGAGKSSVMARLRELAPSGDHVSFASMTCPDFHNTRDVPLTDLSKQLRAFSVGCDEISSLEMKATAMYLQMTLFGPVERHFLDTWAPDVLVFERHPLIELLVYGPLYVALARPEWNGHDREAEIAEVLERHRPGTFDDILAWHRCESTRLGSAPDIWLLLSEIADLVGRDITSSVAGFAARFRTTLPDAVLWLDVPPEQAAARCAERSGDGPTEAHETAERLAALRDGYLRVRDTLAAAYPEVGFHRIDTGDGVDLDESVRACVTEGKLFG
ncbi:hypothetical protein ACFYT3_26265 [Nocardia amikacinitolerans]|uniref:hypothetical protein n=1 Tax=Nocardia amikacinitolerans TaxID=756689 RepID=UPI00082C4148|nr:hypothetical protein [Nocardia amikacinitolerans]MCP2275917.1 hypothetical protein [Nocardia amikacinitolerans]MCP2289683.1 hypothetical protein [Nocardia amikacinitolerans]MCP2294188.1 hypothetical protein [Nocardia amikacinitolerans]MCP2314925.1 hypothetical protein [Nocardia amikacinitolerans]